MQHQQQSFLATHVDGEACDQSQPSSQMHGPLFPCPVSSTILPQSFQFLSRCVCPAKDERACLKAILYPWKVHISKTFLFPLLLCALQLVIITQLYGFATRLYFLSWLSSIHTNFLMYVVNVAGEETFSRAILSSSDDNRKNPFMLKGWSTYAFVIF